MGPVPRTILHGDMDAFYAAVEQRDRPELRGKPVIVGGLGGRGVVTAASYEARPFGVRSAMPMVEARRLCPEAIFLPGRMQRYVEVSRALRGVFHEFTPIVEPLSLDEAFLDVTASLRLFGPPLELATALKRRVREATGLVISVGIGPSKMVAKIASALSKPDGLLAIPARDVEAFLRPLPVEWLWGVGPVTRTALERIGIRSIGDLALADRSRLEAALGRGAEELRALALGRDHRFVDGQWRRKSYGEENTFARDVADGEEVRATIVAHAEAVARRLRADGRLARTVTLKVKLAARSVPGKYPLLTRRSTLERATDDGRTIAEAALRLWAAAAPRRTIRLVGVAASGIEAPLPADQLALFDLGADGRRAALNRAIDDLARRFGDEAVKRGALGRVERAAPTVALKRPRTER